MSKEFEGFSDFDAGLVVREYVCAVCEGELSIVEQDGQAERLVVCPEHGNVEGIGRITKNTVAMRNANARVLFHRVIRNLPEFWGSLIPTKEEIVARRARSLKELGY